MGTVPLVLGVCRESMLEEVDQLTHRILLIAPRSSPLSQTILIHIGGERRVGSSTADVFSRGRVAMTLSRRRLLSISIWHLARVDTAATLLIETLAW